MMLQNQKGFANLDSMTREQLELAWAGSIYTRPNFCRQHGLCGIDQSMFKNQNLFELGLKMLKATDFEESGDRSPTPPQWLVDELLNKKLLMKFENAFDALVFMPALYRNYCREIEKRSTDSWEATWNGSKQN